MKQLVVISGKGGTGKTSVTAALAALAARAGDGNGDEPGTGDAAVVLADCDVDAPNLHLVLDPQILQRRSFTGGKLASIDPELCCACGRCAEVCRFDAISMTGPGNGGVDTTYRVLPLACEGCLACLQVCPADAIRLHDAVNGEWYISETRFGPMVHAQLSPGHENSGKLVSLVREHARKLAAARGAGLILIDGSPGIGCPVIASITGADMVLAVTEPTRSALHDLGRVLDLAAHFRVPAALCVNRWDQNVPLTEEIERTARQRGVFIAGRLAYDRAVIHAQARKLSVVEYIQDGIAGDLRRLWDRLCERLHLPAQTLTKVTS